LITENRKMKTTIALPWLFVNQVQGGLRA